MKRRNFLKVTAAGVVGLLTGWGLVKPKPQCTGIGDLRVTGLVMDDNGDWKHDTIVLNCACEYCTAEDASDLEKVMGVKFVVDDRI